LNKISNTKGITWKESVKSCEADNHIKVSVSGTRSVPIKSALLISSTLKMEKVSETLGNFYGLMWLSVGEDFIEFCQDIDNTERLSVSAL
jgi:hypothetical protein